MKKVVQKVKEVIGVKRLTMVLVFAMVVVMSSVPAFAAETAIRDVLSTAFSTMVEDIIGTVGVILPISLGVLSLTVSIGFAVKWFKKLVGMGG